MEANIPGQEENMDETEVQSEEKKTEFIEEQKNDAVEGVAVTRRVRMKFKNCAVSGDQSVFLLIESSSTYAKMLSLQNW